MRFLVFALSFAANAVRHASIETWSMNKPYLHDQLLLSSQWLGMMDFIFLLMYAIGNILSGVIGDRYSLKPLIAKSLFLSSVFYLIVTSIQLIILVISSVENPNYYFAVFAAAGLSNSAVYPATVAVMGNWFKKESRGVVMGLWSMNSSAGHIVGSQLCGLFLEFSVPWVVSAFVSFSLLLLTGFAVLFYLEDNPYDGILEKAEESQTLGLKECFELPGVLTYSLSFGCLKAMNYSLVMWLPFYLYTDIEVTGVLLGVLAGVYDLGGVLGSAISGYFSDKTPDRVSVVSPLIFTTVPLFLVFLLITPRSYELMFLIVPMLGFTITGAGSIVSGAVANDLASSEHAKGKKSRATIAGVIDGTGGLFASFSQIFVSFT